MLLANLERANKIYLKSCASSFAFSALLQGRCGCIVIFAGSKPLEVEATLPTEAPCRLETDTRPTKEVWRCSGCGQTYTTEASLHVYVRMQRSWEPIPGVPITTRVLYAPGDIKAMRCPPQQVCSTHAAASSASNISPLLSKQLFRSIT
jgi:ribosomal protein L37AE/L43A